MLEIAKIVELAKEHATPMYLFDLDELQSRVQAMKEILGEDIQLCYAMKANPFLVDSMKQAVHKFEVCSPGEFAICEREQVAMADIVLSGVNKEKADILHVMKDCGGVGPVRTASDMCKRNESDNPRTDPRDKRQPVRC